MPTRYEWNIWFWGLRPNLQWRTSRNLKTKYSLSNTTMGVIKVTRKQFASYAVNMKPSLANNVELRQIVNHENDSILFPTLWVYQNTNSSDQTMFRFSQGYCCNGLCICHLRQIRSYLLSKHFFNAFQRRLWNPLKPFNLDSTDIHLLGNTIW